MKLKSKENTTLSIGMINSFSENLDYTYVEDIYPCHLFSSYTTHKSL